MTHPLKGRIRIAVLSGIACLYTIGSVPAGSGQQPLELTAGLPRKAPPSGHGIARINPVTGVIDSVGRFLGSDPTWTHDGNMLAFVRSGRIWVSMPDV